jgi:hypothetical protein
VARHRRWKEQEADTEEMNDFVAQNSSLKQELDKAMREAKEKESMLEGLGAECSAARTNVVLQVVMSTITVV